MFIVLEGLDGAGKSTQIKYLQTFLRNQQQKSQFIHFPRFDAPVYGPLIAKFLRGDLGTIDQVAPELVALIYAGDRQHAASGIREWLAQGYVVIADRYVYSNIAYQCAKFENIIQQLELRNWIVDTEFGHFNLPRPDLNLFLDVPLEFISQRLGATRSGEDRAYLEGKSDIHETSLHFQEKVRQVYLAQTGFDVNFKVISCAAQDGGILSADIIFDRIRQQIQASLPLK